MPQWHNFENVGSYRLKQHNKHKDEDSNGGGCLVKELQDNTMRHKHRKKGQWQNIFVCDMVKRH
eukprot:12680711-Heterocapsa_arctica.AAC.1